MTGDSVRGSPYGDVRLGAFQEVLTYPGRYLNDHCLIRHDGLWHFFGIIGDVTGPGEMHGVEDSLAHATSTDLMQWTVHPPGAHGDRRLAGRGDLLRALRDRARGPLPHAVLRHRYAPHAAHLPRHLDRPVQLGALSGGIR